MIIIGKWPQQNKERSTRITKQKDQYRLVHKIRGRDWTPLSLVWIEKYVRITVICPGWHNISPEKDEDFQPVEEQSHG